MGRIIQGVKIKQSAFESRGLNDGIYWPRIVEVKTDKGYFQTPSRIITSQTLSAKSRIGVEAELSGNISLLERKKLNYDNVKRLIDRNEMAENYAREAKKHLRKMSHYQIKVMYFQPSTKNYMKKDPAGNKHEVLPGIKYFDNKSKIDIFLNILTEIANNSGYKTLAIPTLSYNVDIQIGAIGKAVNDFESGKLQEIIPVIYMDQDPEDVEKLLNSIIENYCDTGIVSAIGFHNSFSGAIASRARIGQIMENKNILTLILSVRRNFMGYSGIHKQSTIFGDSFAPEFVTAYGHENTDTDDDYYPPYLNIDSLEIGKLTNESDIDKLVSEFLSISPEDEELVKNLLYEIRAQPSLKKNILPALSKVHETIFSQREFANLRNGIKSDKFADYKVKRRKLFAL